MSVNLEVDGLTIWQEGHGGVFHNGVGLETTYYLICCKNMKKNKKEP
jgi:hypothetical protein